MKRYWSRSSAGIALALAAMLISPLAGTGPARAATTSTLVNFDGTNVANVSPTDRSHQVTRFDTDGNSLDAEEGQIDEFTINGVRTYVLYGESHNCGRQWTVTTAPFCGFNAYTSPDLVTWTYRGKLFDPNGVMGGTTNPTRTWQDFCKGTCFRPHMVYNASTQKFVLWFYGPNMVAMTSSSPTGGFTMANDFANFPGDEFLYVDPYSTITPKQAYLVQTWAPGDFIHLRVVKLDSTYTAIAPGAVWTDTWVRGTPPGSHGTEAPALFARKNAAGTVVWYIVYSDPNCGYGNDLSEKCGASYIWAHNPLGAWGAGPVTVADPPTPTAPYTGTNINVNNCNGQPTAVMPYTQADGSTGYLFQSLLNQSNQYTGVLNQGLANFYWDPLSFTTVGSINAFTCQTTVNVSLANNAAPAAPVDATIDQNSTNGQFSWNCPIRSGTAVAQTFTAGRSGALSSIDVTTFMIGTTSAVPNANLDITLYATAGFGTSARPFGPPLASATRAPAPYTDGSGNLNGMPATNTVQWNQRTMNIALTGVNVTAGTTYAIVLSSNTTVGCYGVAQSTAPRANPYTAGVLLNSTDSGITYSAVTGSAIRFATHVPAAVTVDDTSASITYSTVNGNTYQGFSGFDPTYWYNGTAHSANANGPTATFTCPSCTSISWLGTRGPDRGIAAMSIDNGAAIMVDTYADVLTASAPIHTFSGLAPGPHTIRVTATGTTRDESKGVWVEVDAFRYS